MKLFYTAAFLALTSFSGLVQANEKHNPSVESGVETTSLAKMFSEKIAIAGEKLGEIGFAVAFAVAGAHAVYEDHLKPLEAGKYPEAGHSRIIFASQYKHDKAFEEGIQMGGSVSGAMDKCQAAKAHYESEGSYGPGACDRIEEYARMHDPWHYYSGKMRSGAKIMVVSGAAIAVTIAATAFCIYRKIKKD